MRSTNVVQEFAIRINRAMCSRLQEIDLGTIPFSSVFSDHMFIVEFRDVSGKTAGFNPTARLPYSRVLADCSMGFRSLKT